MPPLRGLKFEDRAYPALRFPSSPKNGEPGTPLRAGLSCRRPAMRDSIARTPHLSADPAFLVAARINRSARSLLIRRSCASSCGQDQQSCSISRETPSKSMPRSSAAKAGVHLLEFADRLKAVPFKAIPPCRTGVRLRKYNCGIVLS